MVCLRKTTSDEQEIPDFYIAALCFGADVDALVFPALVELLVGYTVGVVGVVYDAVSVGEGAVVEEDTTARDAVGGPVVDGAFVVGFGVCDVFGVGVVVEGVGGDVGELLGG